MDGNLSSQVARCIGVHQQRRRGQQVLTVLAAIVVFCTVYALMMPAVTVSNQVTCGLDAHVHSDDCWTVELSGPQPELVCDAMDYKGVVIHQHNSHCYDSYGELICTLPEEERHTHGESCYQERRELMCQERQEVGHTHGASCWAYDRGEMTCTWTEDESAHTHTDACYQQESRQVLSCSIPEAEPHTHDDGCYQQESRQELSCSIPEAEPHIHGDGCYTTRTERELTCTRPESDDILDEEGNVLESGHRHSSACYTEHEEREFSCSREESEGHRHDSACYTEREERVLSCSREESGGHRHDESCYTEEEERTLVCSLTETGSHEHGRDCYVWTQRLVCQEEEREAGHVHKDECYQISEILSCRQPELTAHTHGESCYGEEGGLLCVQPEAIAHDHDASCVYTPEGTLEEIRVLTCGMQEHEHTESCYVELVPKEDDGCLCGMVAHLHRTECYFEDGTLCCTLPEHVHTLACIQEVLPEPEPEQATGLWLAEDYEYDSEEFHLSFHINGYASLAEDGGDESFPGAPDRPSAGLPVPPDALEEPDISGDSDIPEEPAPNEEFLPGPEPDLEAEIVLDPIASYLYAPLDAEVPDIAGAAEDSGAAPPSAVPDNMPAPEPDTKAPPEHPPVLDSNTEDFPELPSDPEPGAENLPGRPSVPEHDAEDLPERPSVPETDAALENWADRYEPVLGGLDERVELDPEDVVFSVEFYEEGESYENLAACAGELSEDGVLLLRVLTLTAAIDGRPLDLSACTVEVEVTLSEQMLAQLESFNENRPLGIREEGPVDGDGAGAGETALNLTLVAYSGESGGELNELGSMAVNEAVPRMSFTTRGSDPMGLSLLMNVYPVFTVEYYAWIRTPAKRGGAASLSFIDTSAAANGGAAKLPENGTTPSTMNLQLNADGTVLFAPPTITQVYKDKQFQFNPNKDELTIAKMFGMMENTHYDINELWVLKSGVEFEAAEAVQTVEEARLYWDIYSENLDELRFTNNPKAASEKVIPITSSTRFRLMYTQRSGTMVNNESVFYDYDITDGTPSGNNPITVNSNRQGINSPVNYPEGTTDAKFGFGNANTGSGLADEVWRGNKLNQANRNVGYELCTFGLVKGFAGGTVVYSNGVAGPNLFGGTSAAGKTCYDQFSLEFLREGDTHTLSAVKEGGRVILGDLEYFGHPGGYTNIWTNGIRDGAVGFWPMDGLNREHADPEFGAGKTVKFSPSEWDYFPLSDNGQDHNAYFGMNYSVQFNLSEEYVGPLEYYFYGDDDMWVFLGDKLVCDIGGVHKSVGEYVDLWDYIPGGRDNHEANTYTLSVFYTERGASGSTCWMQYTLPNAIAVPVTKAPNQENTPLTIKKVVEGNLATDGLRSAFYTFDLTLINTSESYQATVYDNQDRPVVMKLEDGVLVYDEENNSDASRTRSFPVFGKETVVFTLRDGWYLRIADLSPYAGYDVNERFPDGTPPEGCSTTVQVTKGSTVSPVTAGTNSHDESMGTDKTTVTYTNAFEYELPETGGPGSAPYALAGGLLVTAALWLWYRKKIAGERGEDTA